MTLQFIKNSVFCFTGKSPQTRPKMEAIAIKAGASVTKSITNKTTILVIADASSMSSKAKKARTMGIDLISPQQFFTLCEDSQSGAVQFSIEKPVPVSKPSEKRRHSSIRRVQL